MNRPAVILHVARAPRTGVWSMMRQLALWQRDRGHPVALGILIPKGWPAAYRKQLRDIEAQGVKVLTAYSPEVFGTGAYLYHQFSNPVRGWAASLSADGAPVVVHFHNAWLSGVYVPLRARGATAAVTYHGIQGERMLRRQPVRRRLQAYWARRLASSGVRHASVDAHNTIVAEDLFGVDSRLFSVIPNGTAPVRPDHWGCPRLSDAAAPFTVGHVGLVDEGKGWRITAEAVLALHEQGEPVQLLIAGDGPQVEQAREWCATHAAFARFLGHSSDPSTDVFPRLDLMCLPSRGEGLPMAVLEAFAAGVPVAATAVGGLPQVITDGETGFLVERSPEALAEALRRMIVDPGLHAALSRAARETHLMRFSTDVMGAAYERLYFGDAVGTHLERRAGREGGSMAANGPCLLGDAEARVSHQRSSSQDEDDRVMQRRVNS